jgi:hypothetical protein
MDWRRFWGAGGPSSRALINTGGVRVGLRYPRISPDGLNASAVIQIWILEIPVLPRKFSLVGLPAEN